MQINLIPLYSFLHKKNQDVIKEDLLFIDEINNFLMDEDLLILEKAKEPLFDIVLIGSGDVLQPGDPLGGPSGPEGAVGVDDLEPAFGDVPKEGRVHFSDACDIGRAEWNGDGKIVEHVEVIVVCGPGDIGRDDGYAADFPLHPLRIVRDAD